MLMKAIAELIEAHAALLAGGNHYAYFELAYTRSTGWMAWLCDKPCNATTGKPEPDRKVIACGQGATPEAACQAALESMK